MADHPDPAAFAAALVHVHVVADLAGVPPSTEGVLVHGPTDALLGALAARLPGLRHLMSDGHAAGLTDAGLAHLRPLAALESLDLEWSCVTDAGLAAVGALPALRWVDLGGASGITPAGVAALRTARPDLEVEASGG